MKLTKLFIAIAITGLLLNSCGEVKKDDITKIADMQCELLKITKELKSEADTAKITDLQKEASKLREEMTTIGKKLETTFKDNKKADFEARIKMSQYMIDNCDAVDSKTKEKYNKIITRAKKELEELDK